MNKLNFFAIGLILFSSQLNAETFVPCPLASSIECRGPIPQKAAPDAPLWVCKAGKWSAQLVLAVYDKAPKFSGESEPVLDHFKKAPNCLTEYTVIDMNGKNFNAYARFRNPDIDREGCKVNDEKKGFDCP